MGTVMAFEPAEDRQSRQGRRGLFPRGHRTRGSIDFIGEINDNAKGDFLGQAAGLAHFGLGCLCVHRWLGLSLD
jgi:hypothetical protein